MTIVSPNVRPPRHSCAAPGSSSRRSDGIRRRRWPHRECSGHEFGHEHVHGSGIRQAQPAPLWSQLPAELGRSHPTTTRTSASDHYIVKDVAGNQIFTSVELEDRNTPVARLLLGRPEWATVRAGSHTTLSKFWLVDTTASPTVQHPAAFCGVTSGNHAESTNDRRLSTCSQRGVWWP